MVEKKIKDFPIMTVFKLKNVIKKGDNYLFDLFDWEYQNFSDRKLGRFEVKAKNKKELIDIVYIAFSDNPNYFKEEKIKMQNKIIKKEE